MQRPLIFVTTIAAAVFTGACSTSYSSAPSAPPAIQATVITGTGAIATNVDAFRALLGQPNNAGTAGEQPAGRREISWDGAGANPLDNRNDFPATFFNTNVKAGAVFTTSGTGFRNDSTKFVDINPTYAAEFNTFSPAKIFSPVGSNVMDVSFQVAGQLTKARVTGFGAVFSDVDVANAIRRSNSSTRPAWSLRENRRPRSFGCVGPVVRRCEVRQCGGRARSHHARDGSSLGNRERHLSRRSVRSRRRR